MIHKKIFLFLLTIVLLVNAGLAQTRKPIFRSIDVSTVDKKRSIELGGDLTANVDILIKAGDAFILNGNFGNTKRLSVLLTETGKVREIIFDYGTSRNFAKLVEWYAKDFGKPMMNDGMSSAILKTRMVVWDDGKTRFEIVEKSENSQTTVSSVMIDKIHIK